MLAVCWFSLVIGYGWATHALPAGGKGVAACLAGMAVVGGYVGLVFTALINILLRPAPANLRWALSSAAWLGVCFASYVWLTDSGADSSRSAALASIAGMFGVFVGAPHADLFVSFWFLKRTQKAAEADRDRTLAEAKKRMALEQAELERRLGAERLARLNKQERPQAIRNFLRS